MRKLQAEELYGFDWPLDMYAVIYFDQFGNAVTGIRAGNIGHDMLLRFNDTEVSYARTFATAATGQPFWYLNSMGLVEIAVNQSSAQEKLAISIGLPVSVGQKTG
jgi:S-adenosyl-L-methionine hydrolase (adenosine-forming)